jgi:hypothetical protein
MPLATIADLNGPTDEVVTWIEHAKTLSVLYDTYVNTEDEDSIRAAGIHASEVSSCLRKVFYTVRDEPKKPVIAKFWRQRFKVGHAIHAMVQRDFKRMARRTFVLPAAEKMAKDRGLFVEFDSEVHLSPRFQQLASELNIHSSCDGVFTFRESPFGPVVLRVGVEIKTESPDGYEKLKAPKPEHMEQVHVYMACLDLPLMWFFYFSKGNQNNTMSQAPFLTPFNPAVWARIEQRCELALAHVQQNDVPPREEGIHCEFCPYSWTCQPRYLNKAARHERVSAGSFAGRRP